MYKIPDNFVWFTDIHIHDFKQYNQYPGQRLEVGLKLLKKIFSVAHKKDAAILFSGDLYEQLSALPKTVVNRTISTFKQMFTKYPEMLFYAISGNHDHGTTNRLSNPAETALTHLAEIFPENFKLLDYQYEIDLGNGVSLFGIPYYKDSNEFHSVLSAYAQVAESSDNKKILMIHQTPIGVNIPGISTDTDPANPDYQPFDLVLCGHIHTPKRINPKFIVGGSPLQLDISDAGSERGFYFIDSDSLLSPEFVCTNSIVPVFVNEGDDSYKEGDFIMTSSIMQSAIIDTSSVGESAQFSANLSNEELVTNYYQEVHGQDEELLEAGLNCLK